MRDRARMATSVLLAAALSAAAWPSYARDANAKPSAADVQKACLVSAERGQQLRNAGQLLAARSEFLACQASACPGIVREDCIKWLGEIAETTPTVIVSVRDDDGTDILDATITVDGKPLSNDLLGRPFPVDPGRHKLRAQRGELTKELEVLVAQGSKLRSIEIVLAEPHHEPPPKVEPPPPTVLPPPKVTPPPVPKPAPPPFLGPQRYASLGVAGIGVVTLVSGAFVGAGYNSSIADLRDGCGRTTSCSQSEVDALTGRRTAAYVLTGIGSALVVTGAVLFATGKPRAQTRELSWVPSMSLVGGGAIASFEGAF